MKSKQKTNRKKIRTVLIVILGWLIALGIRSAIDYPEMFLKGFLLQ